ncbi:hypothetical protein IT40_04190 [Paracoccus versutus]|nr:hypothetical protein IT40_04190 [Paracoccus versutus]
MMRMPNCTPENRMVWKTTSISTAIQPPRVAVTRCRSVPTSSARSSAVKASASAKPMAMLTI